MYLPKRQLDSRKLIAAWRTIKTNDAIGIPLCSAETGYRNGCLNPLKTIELTGF